MVTLDLDALAEGTVRNLDECNGYQVIAKTGLKFTEQRVTFLHP